MNDPGSSPDIAGYLKHLQTQRKLSPHTLDNYRRDLEQLASLLSEQSPHTTLAGLTQADIRRFTSQLHAGGLAPASIARKLSAWRSFFGWLALYLPELFPTRVRATGMTPIAVEVTNKGLHRSIQLTKPRVKLKDLAIFSRQFATMLSSGLPILRCLRILSDQSTNPALQDLLRSITSDVERGDSLSISMARHKEFPPLMVSMIRENE